jgi:CheY-like chemotaxis protein
MIARVSATILVVDDDPVVRSLARRTLLAEGLNVVGEADTVAAAMARFPTRHKEEERLSQPQRCTTPGASSPSSRARATASLRECASSLL